LGSRIGPSHERRQLHELTREQLIALLERRDREARRQRRFGLVWERDEIEREAALNADFVALEPDASLACGAPPYGKKRSTPSTAITGAL
jgi:hypothetical protein